MTKKQRVMMTRLLVSGVFLIAGIVTEGRVAYAWMLFVISYLAAGYDIPLKAVRNIKNGQVFDENFLMTIATFGAIAVGSLEEAVAVMLFYQVGELFSDYAVNKSRKSITELMDINPEYANLLKDGKEEQVDPGVVRIGDIIVIKPGEKVPLDGVVTKGNSSLDTKALTGESMPVEVDEQDDIISGSINLNGVLEVRVTKLFDDSTVAKILELVENASSRKAKAENFITKFARIYTPIVVL
ncbi:MAG: heavy metal translocating P-type ATPase, partial [Hungatella sp.]